MKKVRNFVVKLSPQQLTSVYNSSGNGIDILLAKFNSKGELVEMIAVEVKSKKYLGDINDITTGFFKTNPKESPSEMGMVVFR